jgi:hypothetical protein
MQQRIRLFLISAVVVALAAMGWASLQPETNPSLPPPLPPPNSPPTDLGELAFRDGERNPLVAGDLVAGSASFWLSSHERSELERKAKSGDGAAAFELAEYYIFTTEDEISARKWVEHAARAGHEQARLTLATIYIRKTNCADAKRRLRQLADNAADAQIRDRALDWLADDYLCASGSSAP